MSAVENTNKKIVKGLVHIVPNGACVLHKHFHRKTLVDRMFNWNIPFSSESKLIEAWYWDNEISNNWHDHGHEDIPDSQKLPWVLPVELLENFKEGDIITFENDDFVVELECAQRKHRYVNFGNFEDVVKRCTR